MDSSCPQRYHGIDKTDMFLIPWCLDLDVSFVCIYQVSEHHKIVLVAQSCLTLCDPMDCSPPGSSSKNHLKLKNEI